MNASVLWLAFTPSTPEATVRLKGCWSAVLDLLFAMAAGGGGGDFLELLADVFAVDSGSAAGLAERLLSRELELPELVVLDAGAIAGAQGAYAAQGANGRAVIYLNADLVAAGGQEKLLSRVLLEELGHHIDAVLNGDRDTAGDEGELFASRVLGEELTASQLLVIRSEQDTGVVLVDGREIAVEQSGSGATPTLNGFTTSGLVDVSADLQLSFSLPIAPGSQGTLQLWTKAGDLVEAFDAATSTALSFSGSTLAINPTWDLDGNTDYYLTIDSGALQSTDGAIYAGVSSDTTLAFRSDVEISGALGSAWLRDQFPGTSSEAIGNHSALFIRATFPDVNRAPGSLETSQAVMNEVAAFYADNSRGRISLTTTYTPIVTLDFSHQWHVAYDSALNGLGLIQSAARQAALELGFDSSQFNVTVVQLDRALRSGASWGGGNSVWLAWTGSPGTAAHEIGHALNLGHSNSITWGGATNEYGNQIDNMGSGGTGPDHFIVPKKTYLGWLDSNDVLVNPGPGLYRLHAADDTRQVVGRIHGISQTIPSDSIGENPRIALEYRPAQGGEFNDAVVLFRNDNVLKNVAGGPVDLAASLGRTYQLPGSEMYLTVLARGDGYLDIAYQQGPFAGNTAPSAAFTATASSVKRFDAVTFTADAVDAEGDQLVYRWSFSDGVVGVGRTYTRSFNQSAPANITITLEVSDLRGGLATLTGSVAAGADSTTGSLAVGSVTSPTLAQPSVSVLATDAFAAEGGDTGTFTISRIGTETTNPLVVHLTWSGSGVADVSGLPASVTIPADQSSVALTITPLDDTELEAIESLTVTVNADAAYVVSAQNGAASLQLSDNDATVVTLHTVDAVASEAGRDTGLFRIERTGSTAEALTVYYGLSGTAYNGADFGRLDGQAVIPAGQSFTTVAIVPLVDAAGEPEETVTLTLAAFNDTYSVGASSRGTVTIKDASSLPTISVHGTYSETIVTEGGTARIVFTANGGSGAPVDVAYTITGTATSGSDFTPLTGTISLPTGGQQTVTLAIPTIADGLAEHDESLILTLSPSASYALGLDTSTQITILEPINTAAGGDRVRLSRYTANPAEASSAPADFYIYRDSTDASRQALTVTFALSGTATPGDDYSVEVRLFDGTVLPTDIELGATNSVTIPATADAVIIRLIPVDDAVAEGAESITLSLLSVSPSQPIAVNSSATYILEDNDASSTVVGFQALSSLWGEARNPADNFHDLLVTLNQPAPAGGVQVSYRADGGTALGYGIDWVFVDQAGSDIQAMTGVLSFAAGETSKAIRVRVINDRINESGETFSIKLEQPVNASLSATAARHSVTLYDVVPSGLVQEERWAGGAVFTDNSWDSSPVSYSGYLDGFTAARNVGSDFSRRLTGFITAPASGDYTFYASGDDGVRLYVGTSELAASKVLVASLPAGGFTGFQQWNKYTSQQSTPLTLVAGKRYYVEVQHQEGSGDDHVSIGWTGPGIPTITPITTASPLVSAENRYLRFLTDTTTLTEGQASAESIVVALDRANSDAATTVTVEVVPASSTASGSDYAIANTTLTFAPGEVAKALDLAALVDSNHEAVETLTLRLVDAHGARIISPSTHTVTIVDANAPQLDSITAFTGRSDATGSLLGQVVATPAAGRSISSWEILAGNPRLEASATPAFAIDSQGRISLVNPQALPLSSLQLQLTVRATDNLGSSALTRATVVVNGQGIKEERWSGQGAYTNNDWSSPPAYSATLSAFDPPRDVANSYSRRVTGVFTPQTTGDYSFWIAALDAGRLTIAPWDNPSQEVEIASSPDVDYQAWDTADSQQSAPLALVAGSRYILRAYQRENTSGDHLSVAWSGPGFDRELMPASAFLSSFSAFEVGPSALSEATPASVGTYSLAASAITDTGLAASISEGDFTRDTTLGLSGTAVAGAQVRIYDGNALVASTTAAANGTWSLTTPALADGDHSFRAEVTDGSGNVALTDARSFTVRSQLSVDPLQLISRTINSTDATAAAATPVGSILAVRSPNQGLVTYDVPGDQPFTEERWSGSTAFNTNTWTTPPVYSGTLTKLTTAQDVGNDYSRRITGWITAPATGAYTFYISGDDDSKLYVSSDDTANNKGSVIASVPSGGWTGFQQWDKYSSQKSAAVNLQAGQRYYVEVQHLEGGGGDHVSVGWTGPGITAITEISLPGSLVLANVQEGTVQLVTHGAADTTTSAGAPVVYGGTSADGRHVVFGSSQITAFGNDGASFTDTSSLSSGTYSDLLAYDDTSQAMRLLTAGANATTSGSRQADFVGISADNRFVVYTTDHIERIGGFTAPGKPAGVWSLVEGGYPTTTGTTKLTSVRVADIDPAKLAIRLNGAAITTKDQLGSVRLDTVVRTSGTLSFWVESAAEPRAIKLQLEDTATGIQVTTLAAKSYEPENIISTGTGNNHATFSRSSGVGQTFTTASSLEGADRLTSIAIQGPPNNASSTTFALKVYENNGPYSSFSPGTLVATSTNTLAIPQNGQALFTFDGTTQLSANKVYVFSLSNSSGDHQGFRSRMTDTIGNRLENGQLFSNFGDTSTWDVAFTLKLSGQTPAAGSVNWETSGQALSVATSASAVGIGASSATVASGDVIGAMVNELEQSASRDIVAFDLASGTQALLSHSAASGNSQSQAGDVRDVTLSADGRYVLFTAADASKFGNSGTAFSDATPAVSDLFATDLQTGQIRLLSRSGASPTTSAGVAPTPLGTTTNGWAVFSAADASAFGFSDDATGTTDLIAVNIADGTLKLISRASAGATTTSAATALSFEKIDGKYIYFSATNATAFGFTSDADTSRADLFRYDPSSGTLDLLSHAISSTTDALGGNYRAGSLTVSPNGRYAAFVLNMQASSGGFSVNINGDALFLADLQTGTIRLVNASNSNGTSLSYGAWAAVHNNRRFFTPDSNAFVWDSSYGGWINSDRSGGATGWNDQFGVNAYLVDLSNGVNNAGTAQTNHLLSHSPASTTQAAAANVTLVGVSADSRLVYFTAADASKFGNDGIAFSDAASSATDIFAYEIATRTINLVSGANGTSYGQTATFQGATDGGAVLFSLGDVAGLTSTAGLLSDANGTGTDLLASRFNLLDLATADDTSETGTATDNITSKRSFVLHSVALPGRSVQLLDNGVVVATQTTPASGLLTWSLSNVSLGEHTYTLQDATEAIPLRLAPATGQSSLTVTVVANVNEAPTAISLSANTIAENVDTSAGVLIGTLTITDPDASGNNNTLSLEGADASSFEIRNGTELFFTGSSPDFEAKPSYAVTVKSTDGALTYSQAFSVNVTDVNEAPSVAISAIGGDDSTVSGLAGDNAVEGSAVANLEVSIFIGSGDSRTLLGTTSADANGAFSYTLTPANLSTIGQGSGKHITASQTDVAGNTGTSAPFSFAVDTIAPTLAITTPIAGDGFLNSSEDDSPLTINGTATGADGRTVSVTVSDTKATPTSYTLTASVSGNAWSVNLNAQELQSLNDGRINITANISDLAGNPATQATASFIVDRTPAAVPVIVASTLTGTMATLVITAEAGTRLNIYSGGTLLSGGANNLVPSSGRYSFTTPELADGSYSITATSLDQAGNESGASDALDLTIAPPELPTVSFTDTGLSDSDNITSNGVFSVDNITSNNSWQYSTNAGATWINGSSSTNSLTLLPGTYWIGALRVRQVDPLGKLGSPYTNPAAITVDVGAPTVAISAAKASLGLVGDEAETTTLTFTFSEDPGDTFTEADITVSAGSISAISGSGLTRTAAYTPPIDFVGSASLTVASGRFTDLAGNINVDGGDTNNSLSFSLNTLRASSAPQVSISSSSTRLRLDNPTTTTTLENTATLTFTFTQPPDGFAIDDISASSGTITNLAATADPKVWTATYAAAAGVQGAVSITVAADKFGVSGNPGAGTNASPSSLSLTVDTLAPPTVSSVAFSADSGSSSTDLITNDPNQTVTGTVSGTLSNSVGYSDTVRVSIDNGSTWRLATVTNATIDDVVVERRGFSLGNVTLRGPSTILVVVEDEAGNTSSTFSQAFTYDPITFSGELVLGGYGDHGQAGNIDSTIRQASGQDNSFDLTLPNKEAGASEVFEISTDNGSTWTSTSAAQSDLDDGTYRYRGTVTDTAGNTATSNVWTVVVDNTAPAVPTVELASAANDGVTNQELTSGSGVLRVSAEAGSTLQLQFSSTATGSPGFTKSVVAGGSTQAVVLTTAETNLLRGTADPTGSYTVTVNARAVDRAGNQGPLSEERTFTYTPDPVVILGELRVDVPENGDGNETGATPSIFRISRTLLDPDTISSPVTVTYRLGGNTLAGMDYIHPAGFDADSGIGTSIIAAGQAFVDVTVPTIDNNITNGLRQIRLTLQPTAGYTLHPTSTYDTITLIDNDAPVVPELSVADVSVVEGNNGNSTLTFTLRLSEATSVPVSFNYAFRNGTASLASDFMLSVPSSGVLTFPATARQLTLSASVIGDTSVEVDETFFLDLSAPSGLTFAGGGASLTATATIINDDSAAQVDPNQGVTIISVGNFAGSDRNDTLTGDDGVNRIDGLAGNDVITGGLSADLLFSGADADVFNYRSFAESSLTFGVDTTDADFIIGDRIALPSRPTSLWNTGVITAGSLTAAFQQAQADRDRLSDGNQPLAPGEAVMFTWGTSSRSRRTYLGVADTNTSSVNDDFLLLAPRHNVAIGSLDVQSYFL